ncbi:GbsR/MarR family transcriptional regulator [Pontibacter sp. SGAir0037]|uniref:GbsR/MarR family transcriptional regulator n=1 Tax=Pontibacter sp. SGAir0037 TaxID=2571030 RepID=UPI0010CCC96D|nr:MarR family transcriptional regulator [Pontibacter sp. SGAir0037]QCR22718.1 hypothetical protein C1N53_10430 [Pontibacter sp. SGAir0037]
MELTENKKALVEKIGIFYENVGLQPAAARVMGLLWLSDSPELTFDEITSALCISKSATSNAVNLLLQTGQLEYITFTGDRKRYFRLKVSNWRENFADKIQGLTKFKDLLTQVLEVRTKETTAYNQNIKELSSFLEFVQQELPNLLKKWEEQNS